MLQGGNSPRVTVTGLAVGPGVTLAKRVDGLASTATSTGRVVILNSLNFNDVKVRWRSHILARLYGWLAGWLTPIHLSVCVCVCVDINQVGQSTSRVVFLYNKSALPAYFNFIVDHEGEASSVFTLDRTRGVIPPGLETHVTITFTPYTPANYYARFFCLVEHQHPLYVDLLGTGYIPAKGTRTPSCL